MLTLGTITMILNQKKNEYSGLNSVVRLQNVMVQALKKPQTTLEIIKQISKLLTVKQKRLNGYQCYRFIQVGFV